MFYLLIYYKGGMSMVRFSEHFNIRANRQSDLEFVDIRIDTDNLLFLDPTLMAVSDNQRIRGWNGIIQDFFNTTLNYYNSGRQDLARRLFNSSKESNEIYLGYSVGEPGGNGNTEDSLSKVFDYILQERLLEDGVIDRIDDFYVFVPRFGRDFFSDLIASFLKRELINFTIEQCDIHGIERTVIIEKPYWNNINHSWENITEYVPEYNGKPIVLIPKEIVVKDYLYSPDRYLSEVVSIYRQEYHRDNNTDLHRQRTEGQPFVSKDVIKDKEIKGNGLTEKEYLTNMTRENIELIRRFRTNIENTQRGTNSGRLTDEELEDLIAKSYEETNEIVR